ncbi:putative PHAF1/Protein broad-minded [Septoria linicola]|nr:putative PHAF1/Protein broad-minded [Septoria linicola]
MATDTISVVPGHSLGFMTLGSSLHEVLTTLKDEPDRYPKIDLSMSQHLPLHTPVIVSLPENGIRLRFDGPDQRLRLIEVMDFDKARVAYKGSELVKEGSTATFKRIYQLFGASYPGEYLPPTSARAGTYTLSWSGVAFTFPLQHSAWAPDKDHVSLLGSHAASPATFMALFEGSSWPEARSTLFVKTPDGPRTSAIVSQPRDALPAEIEEARISGAGKLELVRRAPALPFHILLGRTTPQDLLTELGPPDAHHKRDTQAVTDQPVHARPRSTSRSNGRAHATPPSSYSSTGTDTYDTDFDSGDAEDEAAERAGRETFWSYFSHGMDILVAPSHDGTSYPEELAHLPRTPLSSSPHLVVLKVIIHGNVPGSYAFNRHRRLRWQLSLRGASSVLNSEHTFEQLQPDLMQAFKGIWPESEMGRGKVINRTWGGSPSDSSFFLPDTDTDLVEGSGSENFIDNSKLHNFPGLTFEVLSNGAISALTVS